MNKPRGKQKLIQTLKGWGVSNNLFGCINDYVLFPWNWFVYGFDQFSCRDFPEKIFLFSEMWIKCIWSINLIASLWKSIFIMKNDEHWFVIS